MAQLRNTLAAAGFSDVKTLLQSGNVVLECPDGALATLAEDIAEILQREFSVGSRVVVRDSEGLVQAMASDPFLASVTDPARHLVGFASETPAGERSDPLNDRDFGDDLLRVVGAHVYMWCPAGFSASPFFKMDLDRALGVAITSRNWRTVTSLAQMVGVEAPAPGAP
jgi:uncharacterized protein (DUF1697 family)